MKKHLLLILILALSVVAAEPQVTVAESKLLQEIQTLTPQAATDRLTKAITPKSSPALHFALAAQAIRANQHQQAIPPLKQALKLLPDFHRARQLLAQTYARLKQFPDCAQELTKLLQLPTAPKSHDIWALLAHAYAQQQQLLPAEQAIRNAIALQPQNHGYQRMLLGILLQQKQYEQAAALARQLLPQDHDQELTWLALVNPALRQQRLDEANQILTVACTVLPNSAQLRQLHANVLLRQKLFSPAADLLLKLQKQQSLPPTQALSGARALLAAGHKDTARQLLRQLKKETLTPLLQLDYEKLSTKLALTGDPAHDLKLWQHIMALDPHDADALLAIARLQHKLKQHQDALQTLAKLIRLHPHHFESHILLANIHLALNNRAQALEAMRQAQRIFPSPELENAIQSLKAQLPAPGAPSSTPSAP